MAMTGLAGRRTTLGPREHGLIAAGLVVGLFGLIALLITLFGDPDAGAPRAVVSLSLEKDAAPRMSVTEAAATPSEIVALEPELAPENAGEHGGEVKITDASPPQAPAFARSPLPPAPIAKVHQKGPNGPLPIIAADGSTVADVYARPFRGEADKPRIALMLGGMGFNARITQQAIDELPPEVTLSFVPYATNLQSWIDKARKAGHEVVLELPMEPFNQQGEDTGPDTLLAEGSARDNVVRLEKLLGKSVGYFGVTNYQGGRFAGSRPASAPVAQALKNRGLVFLANSIGSRTGFGIESAQAGLPFVPVDRIIDARREADAIDEQLLTLEALALQNGNSIGFGFAFPVTIDQIKVWAANLSKRGYVLAPASNLLETRTAR